MRGNTVMTGYFANEEATGEAFPRRRVPLRGPRSVAP